MGGKGKIAHFTGFLVDPNTQLRIDAVQRAADETNGAVTVVQVIADIDAPQPAEEKINAYLAANAANVDGIVTTAWVPAVVAANSAATPTRAVKPRDIEHSAPTELPPWLRHRQDQAETPRALGSPCAGRRGTRYRGGRAVGKPVAIQKGFPPYA